MSDAPARPTQPKHPVIFLSATDMSNDKVARIEAFFRDADGHTWKTEHLPAFWFDLEFVADGALTAKIEEQS